MRKDGDGGLLLPLEARWGDRGEDNVVRDDPFGGETAEEWCIDGAVESVGTRVTVARMAACSGTSLSLCKRVCEPCGSGE